MESPHALNVAEQSPVLGESTSGGGAKENVMIRGHRMPETRVVQGNGGSGGADEGIPGAPRSRVEGDVSSASQWYS